MMKTKLAELLSEILLAGALTAATFLGVEIMARLLDPTIPAEQYHTTATLMLAILALLKANKAR